MNSPSKEPVIPAMINGVTLDERGCYSHAALKQKEIVGSIGRHDIAEVIAALRASNPLREAPGR